MPIPKLTVGEPDVAGPLAVFPLFGPPPLLEYTSFAEGAAHGVRVRELPEGASVNAVLVENPTALPVLLYEGEELKGAQQDRTVDVAVLVQARSTLKLPVSCVERGRWQQARHAEAFTPSRHAAYPELRRTKSRAVRAAMAAGAAPQADQGAVWQQVAEDAERHAAAPATEAMGGIYEARAEQLAAMTDGIRRHDGQTGTLAAVGGRFTVLDLVSRADVFAALHGPLVAGYALDALQFTEGTVPSLNTAEAWIAALAEARLTERAGIGLGRTVVLEARAAGGTALVHEGETVQLCAYAQGPQTRIRPPSRRGA